MLADCRLTQATARRVDCSELFVTDFQSPGADERARVGLCCGCRLASAQTSARGSAFWRCRLSEANPKFMRYPPLPVLACEGFEPSRDRSPDGNPHS